MQPADKPPGIGDPSELNVWLHFCSPPPKVSTVKLRQVFFFIISSSQIFPKLIVVDNILCGNLWSIIDKVVFTVQYTQNVGEKTISRIFTKF